MKNWIRNWLGIKNPVSPKEPLSLEDINKAVGELLQQYSNTICVQCKTPIVAHFGGWYRNSIGEVFCSHSCIDAHKIIN